MTGKHGSLPSPDRPDPSHTTGEEAVSGPGREDVERAAVALEGVAHRTPLFRSRTLDRLLRAEVVFKGEHLQRGGAFKFRGAWYALSRLDADARARGVVSWSSGNHAGGLALAGRLLSVPVTVVMPHDAPTSKRAAVEGYGATVVESEAVRREEVGMELARRKGWTPIPPYDHDDIIAGQGTAAAELLEQVDGLDLLLTPVGGGGLLAGSALAASAYPSVEVVGVEPAVADDAARSLQQGRIVVLDRVPDTIADGLRTRFLGQRNFAILRRLGVRVVTVREEDILRALRWLWWRMKLVVEPSAAVPLAALLSGALAVEGRRVGVILSGGNVDPPTLLPRLLQAEGDEHLPSG